jgi:hypothetical protein
MTLAEPTCETSIRETAMRTSSSKDELSPHDKTKFSYLCAVGSCSILALVVLAMVAAKKDHLESQLAKFSLNSNAAAGASSIPRTCAERDTKFVTLLEDSGAARSAPDEQLYQAYLIMMKARELCSSGRFAEGIAVYDTIKVAPAHAVAR